MKAPYMYILIFKTLEKNQIDLITNTFNDFDWSKAFDVEEIVVKESGLLVEDISLFKCRIFL